MNHGIPIDSPDKRPKMRAFADYIVNPRTVAYQVKTTLLAAPLNVCQLAIFHFIWLRKSRPLLGRISGYTLFTYIRSCYACRLPCLHGGIRTVNGVWDRPPNWLTSHLYEWFSPDAWSNHSSGLPRRVELCARVTDGTFHCFQRSLTVLLYSFKSRQLSAVTAM